MTPWLAGLALVCSYVGWAAIALTQSAHRDWVGRMARGGWASRCGLSQAGDAPTRLGIFFLRLGAVLLTLVSAALCITQDGWSFGVLMWSCLTCLAALLVALTLTCLRARLQAR